MAPLVPASDDASAAGASPGPSSAQQLSRRMRSQRSLSRATKRKRETAEALEPTPNKAPVRRKRARELFCCDKPEAVVDPDELIRQHEEAHAIRQFELDQLRKERASQKEVDRTNLDKRQVVLAGMCAKRDRVCSQFALKQASAEEALSAAMLELTIQEFLHNADMASLRDARAHTEEKAEQPASSSLPQPSTWAGVPLSRSCSRAWTSRTIDATCGRYWPSATTTVTHATATTTARVTFLDGFDGFGMASNDIKVRTAL